VAKVEASVVVRLAPDDVFAFLADFENDVRWRKGVSRVRQEPAGTVAVGTRVTETFRLAGRTVRTFYEVEAVEPGRAVRLRARSSPKPVSAWRRVEAVEGRSRVTVGFDVRAAALGFVAEPLLARYLGRQLRESLERLRKTLEGPE
jgi:hypothetical protein